MRKISYNKFVKKMENGPALCPHCEGVSSNLLNQVLDIDCTGEVVFVDLTCESCGYKWTEEFTFSSFKPQDMYWEDIEKFEKKYKNGLQI